MSDLILYGQLIFAAFLISCGSGHCHQNRSYIPTTPEPTNCPDVCPQYWDPVCTKSGDEYREFGNSCFLGVYNCKNAKKFTVVDKKHCQQVTFTLSHQTECPDICPEIWDPVCGKRGVDEYREFGNSCFFNQFNCRNDPKFIKVDRKFCEKPTVPASPANCPDICPTNYKPVCGKSGNQYRVFSNSCFLRVYNCRNVNKYITVDKKYCDQPYCEDSNQPVCGFNGITHTRFRSRCDLNMYNYRFKPKYHEVANIHLCDIQSEPQRCNYDCPDKYKPVCGRQANQFYLFGNECQLRLHNCKYDDHFESQIDIKKCHCPQNVCTREYAPICATNGHSARVYNNLCLLQTANCQTTNGLLPVHDSFCSNETNCQSDPGLCENQYYPVCALTSVNGPTKTYRVFRNPCSVHVENCVTKNDGHDIIVVDIQNCANAVTNEKCDLLECSDIHYDPICGINSKGKTLWFSNECVLQYYNCYHHGNAPELGYKKTEGLSCYSSNNYYNR